VKNKKLHTNNLPSGFTTPKDYFDTFEDRLFDKFQAETVIPKETGFTIPDNYFDGLEDSLANELFPSEEKEKKVIPIHTKRNYLKYIGYAAAACVLFLGVINFFQSPTTEFSIDDVVNSEINTFIENDLIAMNNYELMTAFEEENIDVSSLFEVTLNETETIDYLDNIADPYDLLIE
jgi:hypothetical protein